jgi:hypothetical protein
VQPISEVPFLLSLSVTTPCFCSILHIFRSD